MEPLLDRRTEGFSQGERMKVAIARALIHDPRNLVLDEPTNGLDILSTRALRELIRRLKDAGKCILISSHIMQEISALADHIVIIAEGATVATGTAASLLERTGALNLEDAFVPRRPRCPRRTSRARSPSPFPRALFWTNPSKTQGRPHDHGRVDRISQGADRRTPGPPYPGDDLHHRAPHGTGHDDSACELHLRL
jgi:ABC-type glutathione transport system ATPase component